MIDQNSSQQGSKGVVAKLSLLVVSAAFSLSLITPTSAIAAGGLELGGPPNEFSTQSMTGNHLVTQLDFIKWFVALSGDTPLFDELSTIGDYTYWAKKMKMNPKGGFHPNDTLSRDLFGELLADVFKIKTKKDEDIAEVLEREGIFLPPNEEVITWDGLVSVVDDAGFQTRLSVFAHGLCSPVKGDKHKITNDKCTPPPPPVGDDPKRKFKKFKEKKKSK